MGTSGTIPTGYQNQVFQPKDLVMEYGPMQFCFPWCVCPALGLLGGMAVLFLFFFKNLIKSYNMESLLDGFFHLACFEIFCVVGFMSSLFFLLLKSYIVGGNAN